MLTIQNLNLSFAGKKVLQQFGLHMKEGEIVCLLGQSGCGKTTALRAIAGFEKADSGEIKLDDKVLLNDVYYMPAHLRHIGMVFQDYALFPHLTVADNIAFGLHELNKVDKQKRVEELLNLIGLPEYAKRYPHQLSGGQQQRVALARALAPNPRLILLDEPFSNLDADLRHRLAKDIRELLKQQQTAAIMVTHDRHEAFAMADYVGVMMDGCLKQYDTPYSLYHFPKSLEVAHFVGSGSLLDGEMVGENEVETVVGTLFIHRKHDFKVGDKVKVLLRPDDVECVDRAECPAKIIDKEFKGSYFSYTLQLNNGEQIKIELSSQHSHQIDEKICIQFKQKSYIAF